MDTLLHFRISHRAGVNRLENNKHLALPVMSVRRQKRARCRCQSPVDAGGGGGGGGGWGGGGGGGGGGEA